jgi:hypothetical protein
MESVSAISRLVVAFNLNTSQNAQSSMQNCTNISTKDIQLIVDEALCTCHFNFPSPLYLVFVTSNELSLSLTIVLFSVCRSQLTGALTKAVFVSVTTSPSNTV